VTDSDSSLQEKKKRAGKSKKDAVEQAAPSEESSEKKPFVWWAAYGCALLTGTLYWLAFAGKSSFNGFDLGLLTLVAFVPLLVAWRHQTPRRATWMGVLAGATMNFAGFYWLLNMLQVFSGFPTPLCLLFVAIISTYQGGRIGLMGWLYARATQRGWRHEWMVLLAFAASEYLYPLLFPWYYAATVTKLPALAQAADLGGPIFVGLILMAANLAIAEVFQARFHRRAMDRRIVGAGVGVLVASTLYGWVRILQVDAAAIQGEALHVGVVQGNMGLMEKREDSAEGLRRHKRMTGELRQKGVGLVVWSESSVTFGVTEDMYKPFLRDNVSAHLGVPTIFGGVIIRENPDDPRMERLFNTALSSDAKGEITGRYDKHYLLAFGEYLPFGDTFPILHEWSKNSGRFSPGDTMDPLPLVTKTGTHNVGILICYEDILPSFTNSVVNHGNPELLVNMTNDAWFGDTSEPYEHLALSTFRAIEHRRYLIRSTNSGVSAIVDPVGRVIQKTPTFQSAKLDGIVYLLHASTLYEAIGDWPIILMSLGALALAFVKRRKTEPQNLAKAGGTTDH
jgi:apolipoprotein N-acyltransferase